MKVTALDGTATSGLALRRTERRPEGIARLWPGEPPKDRATQGQSALHYLLMLVCAAALIGLGSHGALWQALLVVFFLFYLARDVYKLRRTADRELTASYLRIIEALAANMEAHDEASDGHVRAVALCAEIINRELGRPESETHALRIAALLHDVGKVGLPEYLRSKPGVLSEDDFNRMKVHTLVGAEILERAQGRYPIASIVRSHHERWDGDGYPQGLKGEQIPLGARILAVADGFQSLCLPRRYRRALSPQNALAAIQQEAGKAYDPKIVRILERVYPRLQPPIEPTPSGASQSLVSGRLQALIRNGQAQQAEYEMVQVLGATLSLNGIFKFLEEQLTKVIPFDAIVLYLVREEALVPRFVHGVHDWLLCRLQIPVGEGLSGWAAQHQQCVLNGDPALEPGYALDSVGSLLHSAVAVPLPCPGGVVGVLTLYSRGHQTFTPEHLSVLKAVAAPAGLSIHHALITQEIGRSAASDALTGLPNARALWSQLQQESARAARDGSVYTVFVLDLNGLKEINDTHGHLMGNKVIQAVAAALQVTLRSYDFLARMGGDEFVLLLPGMDAAAAASKRLDLALAVRAVKQDVPGLEVSISMGSATFPDDGQNGEQLVEVADQRMYWHKRQHHQRRTAGAPAVPASADSEERMVAAYECDDRQ